MLRYFYILVCIQLCFCSVYIDKPDYENLERRVRSKTTRLHKKQTKSPKRSQLVEFDVQNFMRRPDNDAVDEAGPYAYRNRKRENRRELANYDDYGSLVESNKKHIEKNKVIDYSSIDDQISKVNTRSSPDKDLNARHFNFHSLTFDDKTDAKLTHNHEKVTSNLPNKLMTDRDFISDPKKKCSFKHMKMPFFSYNKLTTKAKRQKKRKLFCFNCHKKPTTAAYLVDQFDDSSESKSDECNKDHSSDKTEAKINKVSKRAYDQLCPKCIRELLSSLKRKTTKKVQHGTNSYYKEVKTTPKEKTTKQKADNSDNNLQDGYYYLSNERKKRSDGEESERERRLKELEEVEKKIENVHITAPTFTRVSFSVKD